ncbi:hypothetical protein RZS08_36965, partial [Arthrospira platensis SPKY1]|nr:hypothetical protein [Arthrospira platensis SPKY1]
MAPDLVPLTNTNLGLVTATVKSTLAGSSQVKYQAGPFVKYLNVNFVANAATQLDITPDLISALTNQSALISIQAEDANGNFIADARGVTVTSTSGMQFSLDGNVWSSQILITPL